MMQPSLPLLLIIVSEISVSVTLYARTLSDAAQRGILAGGMRMKRLDATCRLINQTHGGTDRSQKLQMDAELFLQKFIDWNHK
ncbi:hypothetical protein RB195_004909 [Necator americanus]|uniref:Secreted protein n=1 Tax=Necator americanus TaxID=51031 RepID=A0ABR1BNM1_NECAM